MTYDEIKGLHEMGFSNDEIMKLSTVSTGFPQQPEQEQQTEQPQEPQQEQQPEQQPEPQQEQPELSELSALRTEVQQLREQLQKQNRQQMFIDSPQDDLQKQTDAIMAELIRPSIKEDKK